MANQYERCISREQLSTEITAALKKIDRIYETVNKILELVCKRNPTLPTGKIKHDLNINADFNSAKDIHCV